MNDIAVLTLSKSLVLHSRVKKIRLAEVAREASGDCWVAGWGNTKNNGEENIPLKLQKIKVPILYNLICADLYRTEGQVIDD